ncbi:hypothetical protein K2173_017029 [Erythroxylum novogranatense]|uniref:Uncharacterized protein n=1 Tax=Erythroxylum novogranatense TaxID=1862640 RepID=A0AAV8U5P6_9ROSI|nr:hypothetical protein K2173_017029 [Erythroxylum novogranatense]
MSSRKENSSGFALAVAGAVAGTAALVSTILYAASGSDSTKNKKTMKAPGRDERMLRADFEKDPAEYFRDLRKK